MCWVASQLFAGAGNQVLVYDVNTGGIIHTQGGHASAVVGVSLFSGFLISASDDGKIGLLGMDGSGATHEIAAPAPVSHAESSA